MSTLPRGLAIPLGVGILSRVIVVFAIAVLAPFLPAPEGSRDVSLRPELFAPWDGGWYRSIVQDGYEFAPDGDQHSLAYFPLYPVLIKAGTFILPWATVGVLINTIAFLGALVLVFSWARERLGWQVAGWAILILAFSPYSAFASLVYSEGLFLLLSAATLAAFDRGHYGLAAAAGALATATRVTGAPLVLAMLICAWREHRGAKAYAAALFGSVGLLAFMVYCGVAFGRPLGFIEAQLGWRTSLGFDWQSWLGLLTFGLRGTPVINGPTIAVMLLGSLGLLWLHRDRIPTVAFWYGVSALILILASGSLVSVDRYVYGVIPASMALAISLERHPRWGGVLLVYSAVTLVGYSIRLAQGLWTA
jgi:hypothetical protein